MLGSSLQVNYTTITVIPYPPSLKNTQDAGCSRRQCRILMSMGTERPRRRTGDTMEGS